LPTSKVSSGNDTSGHSWRRNVLFGLTVVVGVTCVCLGIWQLRRLAGRRSANNAILAGRAQPLLVIADGSGPGPIANRRARITGELDEQHEFVIRDRVVQGVPAVVIVTPLRIPGRDTALLVNRGYVPAPDAVDPHSRRWAEPSPVRFQGDLLPVPDLGDGQPLTHDGWETWKRLDLSAMRRRLPYPLAPVYLIAEADSAAGVEHTVRGRSYPFRAEPPPLSEGPHLMYAVQWFGIAAAVIGFGIIFVLRGGPPRQLAP